MVRDENTAQLERWAQLEQLVTSLGTGDAATRFRCDLAAFLFHLRTGPTVPMIATVLGGTGTGKSTLVNRLVDHEVTAASFRRTFTHGAVAIVGPGASLPADWLGVPHVSADGLPARGQAGSLVVVTLPASSGIGPVMVDTPDLDGDEPTHHAEADRAFRWARAVVFAVTPEKYQMTELLAYFRLTQRYALPALFVMNKCEESAVLDDFTTQLIQRGFDGPRVFAIPRDDAAWDAPPQADLASLRNALSSLAPITGPQLQRALSQRRADLLGRLRDQLLDPLQRDRHAADRLSASLRAMQLPRGDVNISLATESLRRRLQQRSILYLVGPQRILERVGQIPGLVRQFPRLLRNWIVNPSAGESSPGNAPQTPPRLPDFAEILTGEFHGLQVRIDDLLRSDPQAATWIDSDSPGYAATRIDAAQAGAIASSELSELSTWLEQKWNATPRDTAALQRFMKALPGGQKLVKWSEAAPYLLTAVLVAHGAVFGHLDLLILGGYSLFTWLTEKLGNEVTARTRQAGHRITERFEQLAANQITRATTWINAQAAPAETLRRLDNLATQLAEDDS